MVVSGRVGGVILQDYVDNTARTSCFCFPNHCPLYAPEEVIVVATTKPLVRYPQVRMVSGCDNQLHHAPITEDISAARTVRNYDTFNVHDLNSAYYQGVKIGAQCNKCKQVSHWSLLIH